MVSDRVRKREGGLEFLSHAELVDRKGNDETFTPMKLEKIVRKTTREVLWDDRTKVNLL